MPPWANYSPQHLLPPLPIRFGRLFLREEIGGWISRSDALLYRRRLHVSPDFLEWQAVCACSDLGTCVYAGGRLPWFASCRPRGHCSAMPSGYATGRRVSSIFSFYLTLYSTLWPRYLTIWSRPMSQAHWAGSVMLLMTLVIQWLASVMLCLIQLTVMMLIMWSYACFLSSHSQHAYCQIYSFWILQTCKIQLALKLC
jgi:hypothetical protein